MVIKVSKIQNWFGKLKFTITTSVIVNKKDVILVTEKRENYTKHLALCSL